MNIENEAQKQNLNEFCYNKFLEETQIIQKKEQLDLILDKIKLIFSNSKKQFKDIHLLYSATDDGDSAQDFHSKCDRKAPIIVLIKTKKNVIFGGYTEVPYFSSKKFKGNKDDNAFIFSVDKMKTYEVEKGAIATCSYRNYGPVFFWL